MMLWERLKLEHADKVGKKKNKPNNPNKAKNKAKREKYRSKKSERKRAVRELRERKLPVNKANIKKVMDGVAIESDLRPLWEKLKQQHANVLENRRNQKQSSRTRSVGRSKKDSNIRRGTRIPLARLKQARTYQERMRDNPTPAESAFFGILKTILPEDDFETQSIWIDPTKPTIFFLLDFLVLVPRKIAFEIDGQIHEKQREYDCWRDKRIQEHGGFRVIRFTNKQVFETPDEVADAVRSFVV
jgi:very-short-patch-repair endonuclease